MILEEKNRTKISNALPAKKLHALTLLTEFFINFNS